MRANGRNNGALRVTNNNFLLAKATVMRFNKMITSGENALIFYQILSTNSLKKCMEINLENLQLDIGLKLTCPVGNI